MFAALLSLALAMPQDPPVLGLVTTPSGRPLARAEVILQPASRTQLLALHGLAPSAATHRGITDHRGAYRVETDSPGVVLVRHEDGLGALGAAFPGDAQRLLAEPMAGLDLGRTARLWARSTWPQGFLPVLEGRNVRLPAGQYQVWVERDGNLQSHRLALASGREYAVGIENPGPPRFVQAWEGFSGRISPHSWPQVSLPEVSPGRFAVPVGANRLQVHEDVVGGHAFTDVWVSAEGIGEPTGLVLAEPERRAVAVVVQTLAGQPVEAAEVWALHRTAQGALALCRITTDERGRGTLVLPVETEAEILALHPDWSASWVAVQDGDASLALSLARGRDLWVAVEGPRGPGVPGARLELVPSEALVARDAEFPGPGWGNLVAYTDARGLARFRRVPPGPARVHLLDPRYLPHEEDVAQSEERIRFQARPGLPIAGRATLPSGEPAVRALITLRDPEGVVAQRTVATDDRGHFAFTGLPQTDRLVMFATLQREGSTYSRRISGVRSGDTGVEVKLVHEDPVPPNRRRGRDEKPDPGLVPLILQ